MTDIIIMNTDVKTVKYKEYDDYIKGEVLGEGTFAKVREFVHKLTIKRCAAKIFKRDRMSYLKKYKHNIYDNINNEIKLVYKLNHKNIIKFYDVLETNKKIYIFMEYCVGPLSDIIQSAFPNGLPKWQCHHYFCQLIDGLKYLHSRGVYHRDIKDDNLMVDNSHIIKIADFGVSYLTDLFAPNDMIKGYEGTLDFMAPEVDTQVLYSGSKADIWSAGVLLFKMITGTLPETPISEILPKYPFIITEDKPLRHLFEDIFQKDFKSRISIRDIKHHQWIRLKQQTDDKSRIEIPSKTISDIYRGITLLERLRVKYELNVKNEENKCINQIKYESTVNQKDLKVRTDRVKEKRQTPEGRVSPLRRLLRYGLWDTNGH